MQRSTLNTQRSTLNEERRVRRALHLSLGLWVWLGFGIWSLGFSFWPLGFPTYPNPSVFARVRCPRYLMASGRCYWISGPDGAGVAAKGVAVHQERSA